MKQLGILVLISVFLGCDASSDSEERRPIQQDETNPTVTIGTGDSDNTASSDPTDAADTSDPTEDSDPAQATDPTESSDPTDLADTSDASDSTDNSDVSDATDEADVTDPTESSDDSDPSDSSDPSATDDAYTLVRFEVDMRCVETSFSTVYVTGPFVEWCGNCVPMTDLDNDGIWTTDYQFQNGTTVEYKYAVDDWAGQEDLIDDMNAGGTCAQITDYTLMPTAASCSPK